jgi:cell division transport system permease protein
MRQGFEDTNQGVRSGSTPIIPGSGVSGLSLALVIGVLAFLAGIALTGYFAVDAAVDGWSGELTGTVTVQVRGTTPEEITTAAEEALSVLRGTEGLSNVARVDEQEARALLEPWLGTGELPEELPLPALITADVTPELRRDLEPLRADLTQAVPEASLNDHGAWTDELIVSARRIRGLSFLAFVLVVLAASSVIVFAARAGLAAHRGVVEVLHLVGATDAFIARQIGNRYLLLGTLGGAGGAFGAWVATKFLAVVTDDAGGFLPAFSIDAGTALWLLTIPLILGGLATLSARIAVIRTLKGGDRFVV